MHLYRVSAGLIEPTPQLRSNPKRNQLIAFGAAGLCVVLGIVAGQVMEAYWPAIAGLVLSLVAIVGLPMLMLRKGKLLQFSTMGMHVGNNAELHIPLKDFVSVRLELGPKPDRPRRARARLGMGPIVVAQSTGLVVSEQATYHVIHVQLRGSGSTPYHFALNHPKEYGALQEIVKQWQTAGIPVTVAPKGGA